MKRVNYLKDTSFLNKLVKENLKIIYTKINILDKNEIPMAKIEGRVSAGNININGNAAVRRTGSLTFIAQESENINLTGISHLLSINKKINIFIGVDNNINKNYDKIIWFPLGIFVITQPNISHGSDGIKINLSFKDKMCLLNGECGGGLPASIIFHEYDQVIGYLEVSNLPNEPNNYTIYKFNNNFYRWNNEKGWEEGDYNQVGSVEPRPQKVFDIIQTLVANYGNEDLAKIFINDIPLEIKASVRYVGSNSLYYNTSNGKYSLRQDEVSDGEVNKIRTFGFNEDVGYIYTDFTYPGELISGIGENICSVLDKIKNTLGNYEYFYDINGNFVFQEIKNYLNTSHSTTVLEENSILNNANYKADFNNSLETVYTFEESSALISSYSNAPSYFNIKNDFHIWGENDDGLAIHYHLAIKDKPAFMNEYFVEFNEDGTLYLSENGVSYIPDDWRAELYLQGLTKRTLSQRPDIYEQELLDHFDSIYNFKEKAYKVDILNKPNLLKYYIDFLEPTERLHDCSVDAIGSRIYSYQQDKINKLYNSDVPNNILINIDFSDEVRDRIINRCEVEGQPFSNITDSVYNNLSIGVAGYTAQDTARELLYQYTDYNESISIQSIPIYYLDTNTRISVYDKASNIYGDYIINSISLPLDGKSQMSISAIRALERI